SSSVPSVEPWSTTTTSCPRTDSSARSTHGRALNVSTTTATAAIRARPRLRMPADRLPAEDHGTRQREADVDEEEEEAGRERRLGADAEAAEERDEERLADGQ